LLRDEVGCAGECLRGSDWRVLKKRQGGRLSCINRRVARTGRQREEGWKKLLGKWGKGIEEPASDGKDASMRYTQTLWV